MNMGPHDEIASEEKPVEIKDKNGEMIGVGSVIRVAVENLKAHQVPAKAYGSFNEDKEFVPADEGVSRSGKNLILPVGLRGVVSKVYNTEDISANLPIQVKFTPADKGGNDEEGYDPPVAFMMHFNPREVECT